MSLYYDKDRAAWRWQFKAVIAGQRVRRSRLLPRSWSEAAARKYGEAETARTYARFATGKRSIGVPLIEDAVAHYLRDKVAHQKDGRHAAQCLALLLPAYRGRGLDELGAISRKYARDNADKSPTTIHQRLAYLRAAARHALRIHKLGSAEWIAEMSLPAQASGRHNYLRRAEWLRLARACHDSATRALVLMCFVTGQRPGELHRAEVADDALLMPETKNGERALIPVLPRFRYLLRHWPMPYGYTYYSRRFREARKAVGMDHIHLHDLRHSTASALASGGATLFQVGQVLGHKTAQATQRYAHLYVEERAALLGTIWQKRPHKKRA